ncbi:MAG: hypothetical protein AB1801_26700, partial [Chloroflexota bacterium]
SPYGILGALTEIPEDPGMSLRAFRRSSPPHEKTEIASDFVLAMTSTLSTDEPLNVRVYFISIETAVATASGCRFCSIETHPKRSTQAMEYWRYTFNPLGLALRSQQRGNEFFQ